MITHQHTSQPHQPTNRQGPDPDTRQNNLQAPNRAGGTPGGRGWGEHLHRARI